MARQYLSGTQIKADVYSVIRLKNACVNKHHLSLSLRGNSQRQSIANVKKNQITECNESGDSDTLSYITLLLFSVFIVKKVCRYIIHALIDYEATT